MVSRGWSGSCLMSLNYIEEVIVLLVCDTESQQATLEAPFVALQENEEKCFERKEKGETFPLENFQEKTSFHFCLCEDIITWRSGAGQQPFPEEFAVVLILV